MRVSSGQLGLRALGWLSVMAALLSCSNDDAKHQTLQLAIRSDLGAALRYVRVETLEPSGDEMFDTGWLMLGASCPSDTSKLVTLGTSIELSAGMSDTVRLRVTGFGAGATSPVGSVLVEQRLDVPVRGTSGFVWVDLTRACQQSSALCSAEQACAPDTGLCIDPPSVAPQRALPSATPDLDCLVKLDVPPIITAKVSIDAGADGGTVDAGAAMRMADAQPVPVEAGPPVPTCATGDGVCPAGCSYVNDRDCLAKQGRACNADAQCESGLSCAQGFCCETSCLGACQRCDLPELQGYCRDVLSVRKAPLNASSYSEACPDRHLTLASNAQGGVTYTCDPGFATCDQSADPLLAVSQKGCDVTLGTAAHCKDCTPCPYHSCADNECQGAAVGVTISDATTTLHAGQALGIYPTLSAGYTVRALGALIDRRHSSCTLQLALYRDDNQSGAPDVRVATVPAANAMIDASSLEALKRTGSNRVEVMLDPPIVVSSDHTYWIFAVSNADCDVFTSNSEDFVCPLSVVDTGYPMYNPDPSTNCSTASQPNLYAVTTKP